MNWFEKLIEWQVTVTVPICRAGSPHFQGVMALNYGVDYLINRHGDTTRTLSGYIQIAQQSGLNAGDTADKYRLHFQPAGLAGFVRQQTWSVSLDKARIDFVITDTQVPTFNAYPAGITEITASHRQSWRRGKSGTKFFNTITASITPEAGLPGERAWQVFGDIVTARMAISRKKDKSPFLISLDVTESIFSRTHNFSATYRILSSISDFIGDSGMWKPLGRQGGWETWVRSLSESMFHNRGHARLRDIASNDIVISLCSSAPTISPNNEQEFRFKTVSSPGIKNERPPKEKSFYDYDSRIVPYRSDPVVRQSIIQSPGDVDPNWLIDPPQDPPPDDFRFDDKGTIDDVIQQGGPGRYGVSLWGRAKRAGYPIARPSILKIGDTTVHEQSARFMRRITGNFFGIPVYEAMWMVDYVVPTSPSRVGNLNNEEDDFEL